MEGTLAEIRMFAGNFAPRGWMLCNGQLLPISQWTAVFALVGTTYGGDGQVTFGVPDFRGRIGVGAQFSSGPGLPQVQLGEMAGTPNTTLNTNNLPIHNHIIAGGITRQAATDGALSTDAANRYLGAGSFYSTANDNVAMAQIPAAGLTLGVTGSNAPFDNMKPYLGMNFIFCVEGIFPSRN